MAETFLFATKLGFFQGRIYTERKRERDFFNERLGENDAIKSEPPPEGGERLEDGLHRTVGHSNPKFKIFFSMKQIPSALFRPCTSIYPQLSLGSLPRNFHFYLRLFFSTPNADYGMFRYQFKVTKPCRSISVYLKTDTFSNGQSIVNVIADDTTICVRNNGEQVFLTTISTLHKRGLLILSRISYVFQLNHDQ